jgi:hypothetical protein
MGWWIVKPKTPQVEVVDTDPTKRKDLDRLSLTNAWTPTGRGL